jgi:hypothetical protein
MNNCAVWYYIEKGEGRKKRRQEMEDVKPRSREMWMQ